MSGETDNPMITSDEAFSFVGDALGMPSPSATLKSNPQNFLQGLISAWMRNIPWQTVTSIATPHHSRHIPSVAEIKQDITTKIGGLCYQHNVFCFFLLRALGFDVSLIACDVEKPSDHAAIIVHNMTQEGSKHYVDVGLGKPTLRAVPLDFQAESPVYHDSFLLYKFSRQDDVIYSFHRVEGHPAKSEMDDMEADRFNDGWCRFITIHFEKSVDIFHFIPSMTRVYTIVDVVPRRLFLSSIRCLACPNGRFVCIKDTTLMEEKEPGCISKTYFKSRDEMKDAFARYFPQITQATLDDALSDKFVGLDFTKKQ